MKKLILLGVIFLLLTAVWYFDLVSLFSFDSIKEHQATLEIWKNQNFLLAAVGLCLVYISVAALAIPGAAVLTLLCGALFGLVTGTVIASIASTCGATLSFLISRFLLKDSIQGQFGNQLRKINEGLEKEGGFYLFTLRLVPVFPFFLVNIVMGITPIKTLTFIWVSQLAMLPGTIIYVNAGKSLSELSSPAGILSPKLIISFLLLGLFPLIAKQIVKLLRKPSS